MDIFNRELLGEIKPCVESKDTSSRVLYTAPIPDSNSRFYAGLGIGGVAVLLLYDFALDIRAPIGAEFFTTPEQTIGIFVEGQPNLLFTGGQSAFFINLRAGVNFHF